MYVIQNGKLLLVWREQRALQITLDPNHPEQVLVTVQDERHKLIGEISKLFGKQIRCLKCFSHRTVITPLLSLTLAGICGGCADAVQGWSRESCGLCLGTLKGTEGRYSTIEKEALACWCSVKHLRAHVWGVHFQLITDR